MEKLKKTSEICWVFGNIFVSLGVALCSKANLGVSMIAAPAFILSESLSKVFDFLSVGVMEYLFQGLLLIALCLIIKKFNFKYLLCFLEAVIYGYLLDFFLFVLGGNYFEKVISRYLFLIVGDICVSLGVAFFFKTYLPLQAYELFVSEFSKNYNKNINKVKWVFDISLLVVSVILVFTLFDDYKTFDFSEIYCVCFHQIGVGTVITTIINSPMIALFSNFLDKVLSPTPLFPKLENLLKNK